MPLRKLASTGAGEADGPPPPPPRAPSLAPYAGSRLWDPIAPPWPAAGRHEPQPCRTVLTAATGGRDWARDESQHRELHRYCRSSNSSSSSSSSSLGNSPHHLGDAVSPGPDNTGPVAVRWGRTEGLRAPRVATRFSPPPPSFHYGSPRPPREERVLIGRRGPAVLECAQPPPPARPHQNQQRWAPLPRLATLIASDRPGGRSGGGSQTRDGRPSLHAPWSDHPSRHPSLRVGSAPYRYPLLSCQDGSTLSSDVTVFRAEIRRRARPPQRFLRSDCDDRRAGPRARADAGHAPDAGHHNLFNERFDQSRAGGKRKRRDAERRTPDERTMAYEQFHRREQEAVTREGRDVQQWFGSASAAEPSVAEPSMAELSTRSSRSAAASASLGPPPPPLRPPSSRPPPPPPLAPPLAQTTPADRQHELRVAKLLLQSREFLRATRFVRTARGEIDWVATFLSVGFARHGLYALMCPRRKGRWKAEEERYALALLRLLADGTLRLRAGQSVRAFVSRKLHSDDMRVLKKLSNCARFHFARRISPVLRPGGAGAEAGVDGGGVGEGDGGEDVDDDEDDAAKAEARVPGAAAALERLAGLKREFLRAVQLEALVSVRHYLSDATLRELLTARPEREGGA